MDQCGYYPFKLYFNPNATKLMIEVKNIHKSFAGVEVLKGIKFENYSFKSTNSVEVIGDKLYISPLLYFTFKDNPFKQENREYPVDFIFPNQDNFKISLTIPEGYNIETLPESKVIAMPDNIAKFSYEISKNNNQIQLSYIFDINKVVIDNGYYETLKDFFKELVNKNNEHIVLKKI